MLFVRSLNGGVSHSPDELSSEEDIALAVEVLTAQRVAPAQRSLKTMLLRAFPEHAAPELAQVLVPLDDRREVVSRERARLARERDVAVGEQELGLADAARVEDQLAGARVARRVLGADSDVEVAHRDPAALARPAHVDDLRVERQHPPERCDGLGAASSSRRASNEKPRP